MPSAAGEIRQPPLGRGLDAFLEVIGLAQPGLFLELVLGRLAHAVGEIAAMKLAAEIAENAPLGLISTRATMRGDLADRVRAATEHELKDQTWLRKTDDFKEGVKATAERRLPDFTGR